MFILILFLISTTTFAQNDPSFTITPNLNSPVCKNTAISFSVSSNNVPFPTGKVFIVDGVARVDSANLFNGAASLSISTLTAGLHTLTIFYEGDAAYNPYTSADFNYTINAPPIINISPGSAAICVGKSTTLTVTGAANYTWSPATGLNSTSSPTVVASPAVTTTYTVTGTDGNGCVASNTVTVTVNPPSSVLTAE